MSLGAHVSIAGGVDRAIERGGALGCTAIQIFTKNASQWRARPLPADEIERWTDAWRRSSIEAVIAHDSYLINLASPDDALWRRSIDAFVVELERCAALGIDRLVTHPGSPIEGPVERGLDRVAGALDEIDRRTRGLAVRTLLETTAGQGRTLGATLEELAAIVDRVAAPDRIAFCLDTCHVFAAGYDLTTRSAFDRLLARFDRTLGLDRLEAIHLNDSVGGLGSRRDRHAPIGEGAIGAEPFGWIVRARRLAGRPMILETPAAGHAADLATLRRLRRPISGGRGPARRPRRPPPA